MKKISQIVMISIFIFINAVEIRATEINNEDPYLLISSEKSNESSKAEEKIYKENEEFDNSADFNELVDSNNSKEEEKIKNEEDVSLHDGFICDERSCKNEETEIRFENKNKIENITSTNLVTKQKKEIELQNSVTFDSISNASPLNIDYYSSSGILEYSEKYTDGKLIGYTKYDYLKNDSKIQSDLEFVLNSD